ncbi:MAG: hypothetical protein KBT00_08070 [Bacteroidales bacterium]|nr:hypothetical protein [Candidatus Cacconaster merdequi]
MDIGAFSKCVKDAICDLERVAVPHLGVFQAELMPASYSDRQTTINPPYRKMSFRKCEVSPKEGLPFLQRVAEATNTGFEGAEVELAWCLSRLCSELESTKVCSLPGLGKMKANSSNDFFFIPDADLDIYPEGSGFEPICIKKQQPIFNALIQEEKPSSGSASEQTSRKDVRARHQKEASEEPVRKSERRETVNRRRSSAPDRDAGHHKAKVWPWILLFIALAIIAVGVAAYLNQEAFTDLLYDLLYTDEELQLLGR